MTERALTELFGRFSQPTTSYAPRKNLDMVYNPSTSKTAAPKVEREPIVPSAKEVKKSTDKIDALRMKMKSLK